MLTQYSVAVELPKLIRNVIHDASAQSLKILGDASVGDYSRTEESE